MKFLIRRAANAANNKNLLQIGHNFQVNEVIEWSYPLIGSARKKKISARALKPWSTLDSLFGVFLRDITRYFKLSLVFSNWSYLRNLCTCLIFVVISSHRKIHSTCWTILFQIRHVLGRTIRVAFFIYYIFIITMHAAQPPFVHSEKWFYFVDRLIVVVVSFNSLWHSRQVNRQTPKINNMWMVSKEVYSVPKCFHGNLQIKFCQCSREN